MTNGSDNFGDICKHISEIKDLISAEVPRLNRVINQIIQSKEHSPKVIEPILDRLLDYISYGYGEDEFLKLNDYYAQHHSTYADVYLKFLNEIKKDCEN